MFADVRGVCSEDALVFNVSSFEDRCRFKTRDDSAHTLLQVDPFRAKNPRAHSDDAAHTLVLAARRCCVICLCSHLVAFTRIRLEAPPLLLLSRHRHQSTTQCHHCNRVR